MTLTESSDLARQAEVLVKQVPEVLHVGRRSGRAELDEHAEGVHVSELDVGIKPSGELTRSMDEVRADIRARLVNLPASIEVGQPISHRIDHMLSGRALPNRHQDFWRRPGRAARASRCAALTAVRHRGHS